MPNVSFAPRGPRRVRLLGGTGAALALLLATPLRAEPSPAPEPQAESRINLRIEPKAEKAAEPKRELRADPKPEPRSEKAEPKSDIKADPKLERPTADTVAVPTETPPAKKASRELPPVVYARVSEDPLPTYTAQTFMDTMRAAERYQIYAEAGGWKTLPADFAPKPGDSHPAIPSLRHHLTLTGDLPADAPPSDRYDPPLVAAVKSFQARHGLPDAGILGRLTLNALNVPADVRQRQLRASAQRLMGSNFGFGERYVTVNIPSATVEAVENGTVTRRYVAVVGSPDKQTPGVETRITDVNLNPTWTVPVSVIKNEIIPTMRKNPGYLAKNRIRILGPGGVEVDPTTIDWNTQKAVNYTLRQDSGLDNSLGQIRIDMPNRHAIYMHDTPSKSLFAGSVRFHSHGCVRVGQVKEFAAWLLQGTEGPNGAGSTWGPIEIETAIAAGERRDVKLVKPTPVAFVYLTGYATSDGRVHFRDDIYGLDTPPAPAAAATPDVTTTGAITPRAPMPRAPAASTPPRPQPSAAQGAPAKPAAPRTEPVKPVVRDVPASSSPPASPPATALPAPQKPQARKAAPPARGQDGEPVLLPPGLVGGRG
ncbi:L,D-transpeptidase family protein [Methylorubrum rhodesianum]|uniref:L,D-transpeptidase family protein n=1 Tax=Methylorubrum rhodesianum TaxID=29427 RepID=A0ABU9ZKJ7_9HYPH|nr:MULTISPECIES: L,D-transpeptidase family protein [Methylorubrum]MBB5764270.1 peptidoglycan hydrolase-like protein with peptidoglycan-binding domain [Methylorubrum rhodesianum]MBI1690036.1 murein L,D-transpeptidase [Methylorubrum sp. DB1722]MBK3402525.1 L,D-transpeptidase family protein [Methylorubrum rhodesianum]MBY0141551.1 L,D-transpeptidase family protein [Methylorubrum populi]